MSPLALMQSLGGPAVGMREPVHELLAWGIWLFFVFGIPYAVYRALSLPLRRQERGRLFLDIVESCVEQGKSVEQALVSLAEAEGRSTARSDSLAAWLLEHFPTFLRPLRWLHRLGKPTTFGSRLDRLADHLKGGVPFPEALRKTRGLVPPQVPEMVQIGSEVGDLTKVLPACRKTLTGATSRMRSAMNYVVVLGSGFFLTGVGLFLFAVLVFLPRLQMMLEDMAWGERTGGPPFLRLPAWLVGPGYAWALFAAAAALSLLVVAGAIFYIGGPRLVAFLRLRWLGDGLAVWLPWRRKQLQRDFSAMLAILLDAEVPEAKAVELAAAGTANHVFIRRAKAAVEAMQRGESLTDAVGRLDEAGELKWRLANAAHGNLGFLDALSAWHESLEAKAFQQEQTAAQAITTALVLGNGVIVALVAIGLFHLLLLIVKGAMLW